MRKLFAILGTIPGVVVGATLVDACGETSTPVPACSNLGCETGCDSVLRCPEQGVANGNATISGVASVDGFFGSVIRFQVAATRISDGIRTELDAIAASVGGRPGDDDELKAKLDAKLKENVDGALRVSYEPPRCVVSATALLAAQTKCDGTIDPGSASVRCKGTCGVEAGVAVACGGHATVSCIGTAPDLNCTGACRGDCELTEAAACYGVCHGTCDGTCTVRDATGVCAGSCDGTCQGTCTLEAAASCSGRCKGQCTYAPSDFACESTAQAQCTADAAGDVECKGVCSGEVTPADGKAECQANLRADASVEAECKPPSLNVSYQLNAATAGDPMATASFQAWLESFKRHVSTIAAYEAKVNAMVSVGTDIAANGGRAVKNSIDTQLKGKLTLRVTVGMLCAIPELPHAIGIVNDAVATVTAERNAAVDVLSSVGVH
jgi:hypothetical protein